jgi:hypothetical protein
VGEFVRAGDRYKELTLVENPREGELSDGALLCLGERLKPLEQIHIVAKILFMKPRPSAFGFLFAQVGKFLVSAAEKPAPQGIVGYKTDAKLAHGGYRVRFIVARPKGIFALDGRNRMNRIGASNCLRSRFALTEVTDFAVIDKPRHGAYGFFDGHHWIDAVQIVEIDIVGLESAE